MESLGAVRAWRQVSGLAVKSGEVFLEKCDTTIVFSKKRRHVPGSEMDGDPSNP